MGKEDGCWLRSMKYFLVLFNFLTTIAGGGLIGLGVYYKLQAGTYTEIFSEGIVSVPIFIIILGSVLFLIGFMGCCSVMCELKALLKFYLIIVIFILLLQIIVVTMFFCLRELVTVYLADTIKTQTIKAYGKSTTTAALIKTSMDKIQSGLKCCGAHNYTDWDDSYWQKENSEDNSEVPGSCCPTYTPGEVKCDKVSAFTVGCADAFYRYIDEKIVMVSICVGGILLMQLVLAICGCGINTHFGNRVVPL